MAMQPGDREITLNDIMDVSTRFASLWEKVAVKLNPRVGDEVIRNARENRFLTAEGRMKDVLEKWHDQYSTEATMNRLMHAIGLAGASTRQPAERDQPSVIARSLGDVSSVMFPVQVQCDDQSPMFPTASVRLQGGKITSGFKEDATPPFNFAVPHRAVSRPGGVVTAETGGPISQEDIQLVCQKHGDYWEKIAESLQPQVDPCLVRKLRENPFQAGAARLFEVLRQWSDTNGDRASQVQVKKALEQLQLSSPF